MAILQPMGQAHQIPVEPREPERRIASTTRRIRSVNVEIIKYFIMAEPRRIPSVTSLADTTKLKSGVNGRFRRLIHEKIHQWFACQKIKGDERDAQKPDDLNSGPEAVFHAGKLVGSDILSRVVGNSVGQGGEGSNHQIVELDSRGISGDDAGAEAVDDTLDDDVSHGNEALLKDAWNGYRGDSFKIGPGKPLNLFLCLNPPKPSENKNQRQDTA